MDALGRADHGNHHAHVLFPFGAPPTALGRAYEWCAYQFFHHWVMDRNFSAQDAPAAIHAYYDRAEYLAPTDAQLVQWRKLLLSARGMEGRS